MSERVISAAKPEDGPDSGQVSILLIGMMLVCLLAAIVVTGVTSVQVAQRKLQNHADNAALAAADSFEDLDRRASPSRAGGRPPVLLTSQGVHQRAVAYLQQVEAETEIDSLGIDGSTGTTDARTAVVTLSGVAHPPVVTWIVPSGIPVSATGTARSDLDR